MLAGTMRFEPTPKELLRRRLGFGAAAACALTAWPRHLRAQGVTRIGLTPVFLDDQASFLADWRHWLEARLGRGVEFVQRGNYRDVVGLVRSRKLDSAWICGYPYVRYRQELELIAAPLWRGKPLYQSYIIVAAGDTRTRSLVDLRDKVFAYSDPDSNSGCLFPRYLLASRGENPTRFFSRVFFTWSHRNVVEAVATGLAAGGAVDSYVWETLDELDPNMTRRTRIVERSPPFGHTPFVAHRDGEPADRLRLQQTLTQMADDPAGAALLRRLRLDGFVAGSPQLYEGIAQMAERVGPL